eukprot:tig00021038_g17565.t1
MSRHGGLDGSPSVDVESPGNPQLRLSLSALGPTTHPDTVRNGSSSRLSSNRLRQREGVTLPLSKPQKPPSVEELQTERPPSFSLHTPSRDSADIARNQGAAAVKPPRAHDGPVELAAGDVPSIPDSGSGHKGRSFLGKLFGRKKEDSSAPTTPEKQAPHRSAAELLCTPSSLRSEELSDGTHELSPPESLPRPSLPRSATGSGDTPTPKRSLFSVRPRSSKSSSASAAPPRDTSPDNSRWASPPPASRSPPPPPPAPAAPRPGGIQARAMAARAAFSKSHSHSVAPVPPSPPSPSGPAPAPPAAAHPMFIPTPSRPVALAQPAPPASPATISPPPPPPPVSTSRPSSASGSEAGGPPPPSEPRPENQPRRIQAGGASPAASCASDTRPSSASSSAGSYLASSSSNGSLLSAFGRQRSSDALRAQDPPEPAPELPPPSRPSSSGRKSAGTAATGEGPGARVRGGARAGAGRAEGGGSQTAGGGGGAEGAEPAEPLQPQARPQQQQPLQPPPQPQQRPASAGRASGSLVGAGVGLDLYDIAEGENEGVCTPENGHSTPVTAPAPASAGREPPASRLKAGGVGAPDVAAFVVPPAGRMGRAAVQQAAAQQYAAQRAQQQYGGGAKVGGGEWMVIDEAQRGADYDTDVRLLALHLGIDEEDISEYGWIAEQAANAPLPSGWTEHDDGAGNIYFYCWETDESSWAHPSEDYYRQLYVNLRRLGSGSAGRRAPAPAAPPRAGGGW